MPAFSHPALLAPAAGLALSALLAGLFAQARPGLGVRVAGQRPWLLGLGLACLLGGAGLGLAEPRWGHPEHPRLTVHVVLDASRSMLAEDAPGRSRWATALETLDRLWAAPHPGLRYSLTLLTGDAIPVLPPGEDRMLLRDALRAVRPGEIGSPGTSLGRGLAQVIAQTDPKEPAVLLLLGDGEETWEPASDSEARALGALREAKLPLYALALGDPEPRAVPGAPERSTARPEVLRRLAEGSGGAALRPTEDLGARLRRLAEGHDPMPVARSIQPAHPEWGAWIALLGLGLWLLGAGRPLSTWRVRL